MTKEEFDKHEGRVWTIDANNNAVGIEKQWVGNYTCGYEGLFATRLEAIDELVKQLTQQVNKWQGYLDAAKKERAIIAQIEASND